jgi:LDH2 family malate/lactate/ureidoglycolate dehydrogenase
MRPDLFRDMAEFKTEMDMRIQEIRNSTPMEGADPIRLPGEMALERQRQMRADGVPVARPVLLQLREIAHRLDLPDRLDEGR